MKRHWLGLTALTVAAGMAAPAYAEFSLTILHINDLHSRIEPITATDSNCNAEDDAAGKCFGGIARVKAAIDARRSALTADGKNVITLDAGDQYQGSLFYTTYKGDEVVEFMNASALTPWPSATTSSTMDRPDCSNWSMPEVSDHLGQYRCLG